MRNIIVIVVLFSTITAFSQTQKIPTKVSKAFSSMYKSVTAVEWYSQGKQYEAVFEQKGASTTVIFDEAGKLIRVDADIPNEKKLPLVISKAYAGKFETPFFSKGTEVTMPDGSKIWNIEIISDGTVYSLEISGNGTILSETILDQADENASED